MLPIIQRDMSLLVDIGSLLYALVNVFHPDWPIRATFRVCRGENLYQAFHQNSWKYRPVKSRQAGCEVLFHTFYVIYLNPMKTAISRIPLLFSFLQANPVLCVMLIIKMFGQQ